MLIHAICDALLGAAGMGDIGLHFPDTDPRYKGIDSKQLLKHVVRLILDKKGYNVVNMDATVSLERPKLRAHIEQMQQALAHCMGVDPSYNFV